MRIRRPVITLLLWLFFLAQFLPGAAAAVEPDAFDLGPEGAALAVRVKTVQVRGLQPASRHRHPGPPPAHPPWDGQALAVSHPRPAAAIATAYLPRRSPAGGHSPKNPGEDH